jgi:hypothetical protein
MLQNRQFLHAGCTRLQHISCLRVVRCIVHISIIIFAVTYIQRTAWNLHHLNTTAADKQLEGLMDSTCWLRQHPSERLSFSEGFRHRRHCHCVSSAAAAAVAQPCSHLLPTVTLHVDVVLLPGANVNRQVRGEAPSMPPKTAWSHATVIGLCTCRRHCTNLSTHHSLAPAQQLKTLAASIQY